jgi:hypothetical protein
MDKLYRNYAKDICDVGFDISTIETDNNHLDKSNDNKLYSKAISYNRDMIKLRKGIVLQMRQHSLAASQVFDYIEEHLKYGCNSIILSPTVIAKEYNNDKGNISKGIKELIELDVIRRTKDYIDVPDGVSKNQFTVNHNYIYNGDLHKLKKDIEQQRKNKDN